MSMKVSFCQAIAQNATVSPMKQWCQATATVISFTFVWTASEKTFDVPKHPIVHMICGGIKPFSDVIGPVMSSAPSRYLTIQMMPLPFRRLIRRTALFQRLHSIQLFCQVMKENNELAFKHLFEHFFENYLVLR